MNKLHPDDIRRNIRDLPALPAVVLELIRTFDDADADIGALAAKISRDPALAARTLRLANSSYYGLPARVKSIREAILMLGFDTMRTLVSAGGIIGTLSGARPDAVLAHFWRHSMATAVCARNIARHTRLNQEHAFVGGLLHDIGRLVLATRFAPQYAQALAWRARHDAMQEDAEQEVLGIDHQQVGAMLADAWQFPALIQRAIGNHHHPQVDDLGGLASVVHVANAIVHALDLCGESDTLVPPVSGEAWASLRLEADMLHQVFRDTESQYVEASQVFSALPAATA